MHFGCSTDGASLEQQQEQQQQQLQQELLQLEDEVLAANWADSVALMLNGAMWDAELARLEAKARPFEHNKEVRV